MSQENVDLVLRAYRAAAPPDTDWETANALFHPDHVFVAAGDFEEVKGRGAYREWQEASATLEWEADVESAVDVGPRTVLVAASMHARGASSGVPIELRVWTLATIAEGKVIRSQAFTEPAEALKVALEAAGPSG